MASLGWGAGGPGWAPIRLYLSVERGGGKSTDQTKNSFIIAAAGTAPRLWVCPSSHLVVEVGMALEVKRYLRLVGPCRQRSLILVRPHHRDFEPDVAWPGP